MGFTLTQTLALKTLDLIDNVEKIVTSAADMVDHYLVSPETRITTTMCRHFIDAYDGLQKDMKAANHNLQKAMDSFHTKKSENDKKSGVTTIYHGIQKISQANNYMGKAILKNIQLITLDLSTKEPSKSQKESLKKDIREYKQQAVKLFNEGKKLVLQGIKLAATNGANNLQKMPSKISMLFNKMKGNKPDHEHKVHPAPEKTHRTYRKNEI